MILDDLQDETLNGMNPASTWHRNLASGGDCPNRIALHSILRTRDACMKNLVYSNLGV